MIAHQLLDEFRALLFPAVPGSRWDAVNAQPMAYDPTTEGEPGFAYLGDEALPEDPARAAIIGIIDDSIPFAHELLTVEAPDGRRHTRVASIWMQGARSLTPAAPSRWPLDPVPASLRAALGLDRAPPPVGADLLLGRELRGGQIDALLARLGTPVLPDEGALYRAAGAIDLGRPSPPGWARTGSHGAAVAALAAGFPPGEAAARRFPVIAVSLPPEVTRDTRGSLGPFFIVLAYLHILHRAERLCRLIEARRGLPDGSLQLPVVINLSYGITAGPKDGQSLLERFQDALSAPTGWPGLGPVRCVLPAGNHRLGRLHAQLQAGGGEGQTDTLRWVLPPDDPSPNAIELWGPPEDAGRGPGARLEVAIRPPGAPDFVTAPFPGDGWVALEADGREIARLRRARHATPVRARDVVTVMLHPTAARQLGDPVAVPGEWQLRVSGPSWGPIEVTVQRDETVAGFRFGARQSSLTDTAYLAAELGGLPILDDPAPPLSPIRRRGTLNAYATGLLNVRVGGAIAGADASRLAAADPLPGFSAVAAGGIPDAPYSGMDEQGFGGSLVAAAAVPGLAPPLDSRWRSASERSHVREGLIVPGVLSGSRQILGGTSLAAPQVTRFLACQLAGGP